MRSPKTPVSTWVPSAARAVQNSSYSGSACSGGAAFVKLGRLPFSVFATRVN
jgi:hypothetical protein